MNVTVLDSKYWPDLDNRGVKKQEIQKVVEDAAAEVVQLIPFLPDYANLVVHPSDEGNAIPETGVSGMTYNDEYSELFFDHTIPYGKEKLFASIRTTTFHELVHATSFQYESWQPGVLFGAVTEGLATVFERDYTESYPLWGEYENDATMHQWLDELKQLPTTGEKNQDYFVNHPDGRKWIAYKTGVWIIDRLLDSGEGLFELMKLKHEDVLAKFETRKD